MFSFRVSLVVLKVSDDAAQLSKYPVLASLEQRTQVPKAYAFIGAVTLLTLLHLVNALAAPVSNLIGWGLPAYLSFKALESPGNDDDAQWLTYWIIFGFFNFAEGFVLRALLYYFPWYFSFKTLFILWLQLPAFRVSIPHYLIFCTHIITRSRVHKLLTTVYCGPSSHSLATVPALPAVFLMIRSPPKGCVIVWPQQRPNKLPLAALRHEAP
jgi:TB2/DP1, HVA22 family